MLSSKGTLCSAGATLCPRQINGNRLEMNGSTKRHEIVLVIAQLIMFPRYIYRPGVVVVVVAIEDTAAWKMGSVSERLEDLVCGGQACGKQF